MMSVADLQLTATERTLDMTAPKELLSNWLDERLEPSAQSWLAGRRQGLASAYTDRALHITLGMAPRRVGKQDLALGPAQLEQAQVARSGWDPRWWGVADAARVLVLLETAASGNQSFADRFVDLCRNAEVGELIAFYRGLPLYPDPAALEIQAAEGLRTNVRSVFEAVAHNNPYPKEQFTMERWNQMVLKALFIDSSLAPIQGLDERANPELARIMCDYAHERWAADRDVSPELWRCVGPFAEGAMLDDLNKVVQGGSEVERRAAALALHSNSSDRAAQILASAVDLQALIETKAIAWDSLQ